jgi:cell division protein FtsZ
VFKPSEEAEPHVKIKVIGVGDGGGRAIDAMIQAHMEGVEFITADADLQALSSSLAPMKIQLGEGLTKGFGAGANPEIGKRAALEAIDRIAEILDGTDMVIVVAGMGGGIGTGAGPVIARIAKEKGCLTAAVVTKPFLFEGKRRLVQAEAGLQELRSVVDIMITIPAQALLAVLGKQIRLRDAFHIFDDVILKAVQGITNLLTMQSLINIDFADVKWMMAEMGIALMGIGVARGDNRAVEAARNAIESPLLEGTSVKGAHGILINVTAGFDLTPSEVDEVRLTIREAAHEDAQIIIGSSIDGTIGDELRVTVIATGFGGAQAGKPSSQQKVHAKVGGFFPQEDISLQDLEALLSAVEDFMDVLGYELETELLTAQGSFFQELIFWSKNKFTRKEVDQIYEQGKEALLKTYLDRPGAEAADKLADAAAKLIKSLEPFETGVIRLGEIIVIKITQDGKPSIRVETIASELARALARNPFLLKNPDAILGFFESGALPQVQRDIDERRYP